MTPMLLNGVPPAAEDLRGALVNYGHFTSMQVRGGAVRGLDLHLQRLRSATRELFAVEFDAAAARDAMRRAIAQMPDRDCGLRVAVFAHRFDAPPADVAPVDVLVTASAPSHAPQAPWRLKSYRYQRTLPHLKHVGTFPLFHYAGQARAAGFDDALFVDDADRISEGSIWNLGFWSGRDVVWPEAPALRGTCERLLRDGLASLGVAQRTRPVGLEEVGGFAGAFAANSRGVTPIAGIDGVDYRPDAALPALLAAALDSRPWQVV